jgi:hypothetical protein
LKNVIRRRRKVKKKKTEEQEEDEDQRSQEESELMIREPHYSCRSFIINKSLDLIKSWWKGIIGYRSIKTN